MNSSPNFRVLCITVVVRTVWGQVCESTQTGSAKYDPSTDGRYCGWKGPEDMPEDLKGFGWLVSVTRITRVCSMKFKAKKMLCSKSCGDQIDQGSWTVGLRGSYGRASRWFKFTGSLGQHIRNSMPWIFCGMWQRNPFHNPTINQNIKVSDFCGMFWYGVIWYDMVRTCTYWNLQCIPEAKCHRHSGPGSTCYITPHHRTSILYMIFDDLWRCITVRLPRSRRRPDVAKVRIRAPIASVPAIQRRNFSCDEFVREVWVTVWGWMGQACWYLIYFNFEHTHTHTHTHTSDSHHLNIEGWWVQRYPGQVGCVLKCIEKVWSWIAIVQIGRVKRLKGRTWKDMEGICINFLEDFGAQSWEWCATAAALFKKIGQPRYSMIQPWHVMADSSLLGQMFLMASFGSGLLAWLGKTVQGRMWMLQGFGKSTIKIDQTIIQ